MHAMHAKRAIRPALVVSTLMLSAALVAPAMAQIEEVVVTAQRRTENIQNVPIAVTAYTSEDLKAHQIEGFRDLQFSTPNVTYSQGNFAGADFQIRGIGITAVGHDSESGVAFNFDNVFLAAPPTDGAQFYDLSDLEVLRGPQSTLYGRGATGGAVNVFSTRPDLEEGSAHLDLSYGNYNAAEVSGDVNMPIVTDELGIRIAGDWLEHDGYVTNIADNSHIDGRDQYSIRGSLRWEPTSKTTIDFVAQFSNEDDNRMRADKELCDTDPTGLLGCLPDGLSASPVNLNATFLNIPVSQQAIENSPIGILGSLAGQMGLFNLQTPFSAPANFNPANYREDNVDFTPVNKQQDNFMSGEWKQTITPWLDSDLILGYDHGTLFSQQSYVGTPGLPFNQATLGTYTTNPGCAATLAGAAAEYTFGCIMTVLGNAFGAPNYGAQFAPYFTAVPGSLPTSSFNNLGISSGSVQSYMNSENAYDQSSGSSQETSAEMRFNTKFEGPLNAMMGLYYLHQNATSSYQVASNTLDYGGILLGGFAGLIGNSGSFGPNYGGTGARALCLQTGCLVGPTYYDNDGSENTLTSKAIYGEVNYVPFPDTLTLTAGARFTEDQKFQQVRITDYDGLIPIGSNSYNGAVATLAAEGQHSFDPNNTTCFAAGTACPAFQDQSVSYDKWTGEAKVSWTPKLDFTDQTLVYASYSSGYKAGGFNPGVEANLGTLAQTYLPELVDAYEVGTKNQLFGSTLQANGDIWYYNYQDLQVSAIVNNTSVNENINAKLWGLEGEFVWLPIDRLQFDMNLASTQSAIGGNVAEVDQRRPTGNDPNAILIKDDTLSSTVANNCVMYYAGAAPGTVPSGYTPFQGNIGALSSQGIPYAVFGACDPTNAPPPGFSWTDPAYHADSNGVPVSLSGNQLQNTPDLTISLGAQYTQPLGNEYRLVGRVDYYWQSHMWGRIFEDPADYINSWDVMNASLTLNAPDDRWYVQAFIKNIFNSNNITGEYLSSATSGLFTNAFLGDPRLYGIKLGITL